ncbi:MAG: hypothetical protein IJC56_10825 [Clostridia bacterium]|nr:hypothetical protein [Clostridia bacterium]
MKKVVCLMLVFLIALACVPAAMAEGELAVGKFRRFSAHSGLVWVLRRDVQLVQVYTETGDLINEFDPGLDLMYTQVYAEYDYAYFVADDGTAQTILKIDMDGKLVGEWPVAAEMHVRQVEPMDSGLLLIIDKEPQNRYGDSDGLDNYGFYELYEMNFADGSFAKVESMPEISWVQYNGQYIVGVDGVEGDMYVMDAESRDVDMETTIPGLYTVELFGDNTCAYMINDINTVPEMPVIYGVMDIDSGEMTELLRIAEAANFQNMCATENCIIYAFRDAEALSVIEIE